MDKERKLYTIILENDPNESYQMSLTEDQVRVFRWLKTLGYCISIIESGDVITL